MARNEHPRFHGFLVIDKPAGWTSHDVVAKVRRLTHQRTVGHAGTLDPAATGVLPIALGDATRVLPVAMDSSKTYRAEITFGIETDTDDADGQVIGAADTAGLTRALLESALATFAGTVAQQAPRYSAIQREGKRLYDLARSGIAFEPPFRQVVIHQIAILSFNDSVLTLCVDCGAGTYIRSLARDLGALAGTGAYLSDLVRLRSGRFTLDDAWTLTDLERVDLESEWPSIAYHPDSVMLDAAAVILDEQGLDRWRLGQVVPAGCDVETGVVRVYGAGGDWVGFGERVTTRNGVCIQPRRVVGVSTVRDVPAGNLL